MQLIIGSQEVFATLTGFAAIQFLLGYWFKARLTASIKDEKDRLMEEYKYEIKAREQASKVAEYFSYYFRLGSDKTEADYRKINQLAWELALWLPEDIYRHLRMAAVHNNKEHNICSSLIVVRSLLLKNPGNLTQDEILYHAPGAAKHAKGGEKYVNGCDKY